MKRQSEYVFFSLVATLLSVGQGFAAPCGTGSAQSSAGITTLCNPIKSNTLQELLTTLVDILMLLALPVLTLAFLWAGLKFILAKGNPEELKTAKMNILWTIVGAAIVIGIKVIMTIVEGTVTKLL